MTLRPHGEGWGGEDMGGWWKGNFSERGEPSRDKMANLLIAKQIGCAVLR